MIQSYDALKIWLNHFNNFEIPIWSFSKPYSVCLKDLCTDTRRDHKHACVWSIDSLKSCYEVTGTPIKGAPDSLNCRENVVALVTITPSLPKINFENQHLQVALWGVSQLWISICKLHKVLVSCESAFIVCCSTLLFRWSKEPTVRQH